MGIDHFSLPEIALMFIYSTRIGLFKMIQDLLLRYLPATLSANDVRITKMLDMKSLVSTRPRPVFSLSGPYSNRIMPIPSTPNKTEAYINTRVAIFWATIPSEQVWAVR